MVFAKAPVPGHVKTRLIGYLGADQAAALHSALLLDLLSTLETVDARLELHTDVETDAWRGINVARGVQSAGDLGQKMYFALVQAFERKHPQAVILGSDMAPPPASHLENLLASPADVTLGPSEDGGFYAIACRRIHPAMFDAVEWSRPDTFDRTVAAVERCGLSVKIAPAWWDIDLPADVERLAQQPNPGTHTARWLQWRYENPPVHW